MAHEESWLQAVMLTRPQPYEAEAEAKTHEAEAKAEARFFGLEAEAKFEAKFLRQQRFEKPKISNGSLVKTRRHVQNVRN